MKYAGHVKFTMESSSADKNLLAIMNVDAGTGIYNAATGEIVIDTIRYYIGSLDLINYTPFTGSSTF